MNSTQNKSLSLPEIRPRFQFEASGSIDELTEKISFALSKPDATCRGRIDDGYATFYLPKEEQHYWSPQLRLTLETTDKGTLIRGYYAPRPSVWTMFVFFYSLIAFAVLIIGIIGLSYLSLDKSAIILWWIPVLVLIFLTLYLVAYFGQKMGEDQMVTLHRFLENSIGT